MLGLCLVYAWFMLGLLRFSLRGKLFVYAWFMLGLLRFSLRGKLFVYAWFIGFFQEGTALFMLGLCLVYWIFSKRNCLVYAWFMFGLCLVYVQFMLGLLPFFEDFLFSFEYLFVYCRPYLFDTFPLLFEFS
jgi:hypothetical protein